MIKRALLLLLLTAVWAFGSWWYYTCMIKGFCRADGELTSAVEKKETTPIATTAISTGAATVATTTDFVDQDGDAISDEDERALGTDPTHMDSDRDGILDNEELGIDLVNPIDTDNDGIINALDDDDDNDGIPSQLEAIFSSNPLSVDSDGDGINDGDELGADKNTPADSDNDGIIDLLDTINDNAQDTNSASEKSDTGQVNNGEATTQALQSEKTDQQTGDEAPAEDNAASDETTQSSETVSDNPDNEVTVDASAEQQGNNSTADIPIQKSRLYFPFRSANPGLSKAATEYFQKVVAWLNENPLHSVVLTGHTDDVGKAKNNLDLGLKRAIEIKDIMTKLGANPVQVDVASMGETQPIASNKTVGGRHKNRRVELIPTIKQ